MKHISFILTAMLMLSVVTLTSKAQDTGASVRAWEDKITMPTYLLDPAEQAPIFERDWSYQRAKRSV